MKGFPGRRFASIEEADRATEEQTRFSELLRKLKSKLGFSIYKITRVDPNGKEEEQTTTQDEADPAATAEQSTKTEQSQMQETET